MIEILIVIFLAVITASWMIREKNEQKFEIIRKQINKYSALAIISILSFYMGTAYMLANTGKSTIREQYDIVWNNTTISLMFFLLLILGLFLLSSLHEYIKDKQ